MTAEELYQKGCNAYDENDFEAAFSYYLQAAEMGNTEAECEVGFCYLNGDGVLDDDHEAAKWFQRAAEKGNMEAQYELGEYYSFYYWKRLSMENAFGWYLKAADQGHLDSAYKVAMMYKAGTGTGQNYEKALEYFMIVANSKGDPFENPIEKSMKEIGWLYYYGQGVEKDEYTALLWFKDSVEQFISYPNPKHWTEKVKSIVRIPSDPTVWEHLSKYIDKDKNLITRN